jgi:hypothetical protein
MWAVLYVLFKAAIGFVSALKRRASIFWSIRLSFLADVLYIAHLFFHSAAGLDCIPVPSNKPTSEPISIS